MKSSNMFAGVLRSLSGGALAAGLVAATPMVTATGAGAATLETGAFLDFDQGFWDPESACSPNLANGFSGNVDFTVSGFVGFVSAFVDSAGGPRFSSSTQSAQLTIANNSNATCEIFDLIVDGGASTLLTTDGPFQEFPRLVGESSSQMTFTGPDGSTVFRRSAISEDSDSRTPPYDDDYFDFDSFPFSRDFILAPGEVATLEMEVSASAQVVPLPPALLAFGSGLLLLAGLARRRRR